MRQCEVYVHGIRAGVLAENERGTYILKPRPNGYHILNKDYCAANEHLTMQIASQVYGIETAANALCFFRNHEAAYITRRFDIHPNGKYQQEDFLQKLSNVSWTLLQQKNL